MIYPDSTNNRYSGRTTIELGAGLDVSGRGPMTMIQDNLAGAWNRTDANGSCPDRPSSISGPEGRRKKIATGRASTVDTPAQKNAIGSVVPGGLPLFEGRRQRRHCDGW